MTMKPLAVLAAGVATTVVLVTITILAVPRQPGSFLNASPPAVPTNSPLPIQASIVVSEPTRSSEPSLDDQLGPCGLYVDQVDRVSEFYTVRGVSSYSNVVLAGVVMNISTGHWATADGRVPSDKFGAFPTADAVYRVVEMRVDSLGKTSAEVGVRVGSIVRIRVLGGSIGCRIYAMSDDEHFDVGDSVLAFLGHQPTLKDAPEEDFDAVAVWRVHNGTVVSRDGVMTVEDALRMSTTPPG